MLEVIEQPVVVTRSHVIQMRWLVKRREELLLLTDYFCQVQAAALELHSSACE